MILHVLEKQGNASEILLYLRLSRTSGQTRALLEALKRSLSIADQARVSYVTLEKEAGEHTYPWILSAWPRYIIIFNESLAKKLELIPQAALSVITLPSLEALLSKPMLKAHAWQQLAPINWRSSHT